MDEEDQIITETQNKILEIFNVMEKEMGKYPKHDIFRKKFLDLIKQNFPRFEEKRLIQAAYYGQDVLVDFIINTIPVKITNDIHGIGSSIMREVLSRLSCRIGIVINVTSVAESEFIIVDADNFSNNH